MFDYTGLYQNIIAAPMIQDQIVVGDPWTFVSGAQHCTVTLYEFHCEDPHGNKYAIDSHGTVLTNTYPTGVKHCQKFDLTDLSSTRTVLADVDTSAGQSDDSKFNQRDEGEYKIKIVGKMHLNNGKQSQ